MNLSNLAARYAQTPPKICVAIPLLIMGILYWLSSIPGTRLPNSPELYGLFYWMPPALQNILHVPAFAALAWAWHWALSGWVRSKTAVTLFAIGLSVICGILDEWHQSFVPGRYASVVDVIFDIAGVGLGIWLAARASRYLASNGAAVAARAPQARPR